MIPSAAQSNAFTAFFANSVPIVGETVLILGVSPYSFLNSAFNFLTSSFEKSCLYRMTARSFLFPEMTISSEEKPILSI